MKSAAHVLAMLGLDPRLRPVRGLAAGLALCVLAATGGRAQEPYIQLPPMMVAEKLLPLRWRYVELPDFEILSTCPDSILHRFVESYYRQEQLIALLLPDRFRAHEVLRPMHILADRDATRRISEDVIQELFASRGRKMTPAKPAVGNNPPGRRRRRADFLPNLRLDDNDITAVFVMLNSDDDNAGNIVFTTGRMAMLLERRVPALPAWFRAGFLSLYATATFTSEYVDVGPAIWTSRAEAEAVVVDPDRPRMILSPADLFERGGIAGDRTPEATQMWRAQAELFVRWAMFSADGQRREKLWQFLDLASQEPVSEELFRRCFDLGYADLRDRLSDYLNVAVGRHERLEPRKFAAAPRYKIKPAGEDEIGRLRGDWERMEVRYLGEKQPELAEKYLEQARHTLQRAYDRGARDPRFYAVWGICEFDAGAFDSAREKLGIATAAGVVRPHAYYALARLLYDEGLARAEHGLIDAALTDRVVGLLETSRRQSPLREVYTLLAEVWAHTQKAPGAVDLAALDEGARLFPASTDVVGRVAVCYLQRGEIARADAVLALALGRVSDARLRAHYAELRERLAKYTIPGQADAAVAQPVGGPP